MMTSLRDAFVTLALGRLRRGVHSIVDEAPEDGADGFDDGPAHFGQCAPERRAAGCPVCAAGEQGDLSAVVEAYLVTSPEWAAGCILPGLRAALEVMGEEMAGKEESVSFTVSRWWMVGQEMDRLPEFER